MSRVKLLVSLLFLVVSTTLGCGGDSGPTGPGGNTVTKAEGTWNSKNVNSDGTPSSRYYFEPVATPAIQADAEGDVQLVGEAYFRWNGVLEHVGSLTGTFSEDGSVTWTTILNQNGWEGTEVIDGTITGNDFTGDYVVRNLEGTVVEQGAFSMKREADPVVLAPGVGVLGAAGPWRGAILYLSLSDCNATGFLLSVVFDESTPVMDGGEQVGVDFVGTASGRTFGGGSAQLPLSAFLGPLRATLTGRRYNDGRVEFTLAGKEMKGTFAGGIFEPPGGGTTGISGSFDHGSPCSDGTSNFGGFTLTSARAIVEP